MPKPTRACDSQELPPLRQPKPRRRRGKQTIAPGEARRPFEGRRRLRPTSFTCNERNLAFLKIVLDSRGTRSYVSPVPSPGGRSREASLGGTGAAPAAGVTQTPGPGGQGQFGGAPRIGTTAV